MDDHQYYFPRRRTAYIYAYTRMRSLTHNQFLSSIPDHYHPSHPPTLRQQYDDAIWRHATPVYVNNLPEYTEGDDGVMMIINEIVVQHEDDQIDAASQAQAQRHDTLEDETSSCLEVRNSDHVGDEECHDICVVCQDVLCLENIKIGKLHCGHEYHVQCITQWLHRKNTCPLCQSVAMPMDTSSQSS